MRGFCILKKLCVLIDYNIVAFYYGCATADLATTTFGAYQFTSGISIAMSGVSIGTSGVVLISTGGGTVIGVPAVAVSVPLVVAGTVVAVNSFGVVYVTGRNYDVNIMLAKSSGDNGNEGVGNPELGSVTGYEFKQGIDLDLRGSGKTYLDALDEAFIRNGTPKSDFRVTKLSKDANVKLFPVEWRANNGAEVNIDIGHTSNGPDVPHIGYQTGGKRGSGGAVRGHILVDDVPVNR